MAAQARTLWDVPVPPARATVAVPIWRDPWMVVGAETYTSDLLARAGLANAMAGHEGRYPAVEVDEIEASHPDLVLLPDEPYVFTPDDGPEVFTLPVRHVEGRLITWYGPAMVEAHEVLSAIG